MLPQKHNLQKKDNTIPVYSWVCISTIFWFVFPTGFLRLINCYVTCINVLILSHISYGKTHPYICRKKYIVMFVSIESLRIPYYLINLIWSWSKEAKKLVTNGNWFLLFFCFFFVCLFVCFFFVVCFFCLFVCCFFFYLRN
jgi:hypothetical protein